MRTRQPPRMRPVRARLLENRRKQVRVGMEPGTWGRSREIFGEFWLGL